MTRLGVRQAIDDRDDAGGERCVPALRADMSVLDAARVAAVFKALSSPIRLRLLVAMQAAPAGEACVCDLAGEVGVSQPTVSHHLAVLIAAGVARRDRRGTWAWYALVPEGLDAARALVSQPVVLVR
jgi:ArsR family transcriptional regulator